MSAGLLVEYFLGMYANLFIHFPEGADTNQLWEYASHQLPLVLHIIFGLLLLLGSILFIIRSAILKNKTWVISSVMAFLAILVAVYGGESFITTQKEYFSYLMSAGFIAALLSYIWGMYQSKENSL